MGERDGLRKPNMSPLGHFRRSARAPDESALPPTAAVSLRCSEPPVGPKNDINIALSHLFGRLA
jgi:hypothetical protein